MKVLIIGCGRVGSRLADRLSREGNEVTVIDFDREAFNRLSGDFHGSTFQGSGLDADVLRRGGVGQADVVLALTGGDNRNLMIAQMVKHQYNVQRAVARVHDPVRGCKYRELGIETMCTTTIIEGLLAAWTLDGHFPALPGDIPVHGDASALDD